jgi:hypothetical protein
MPTAVRWLLALSGLVGAIAAFINVNFSNIPGQGRVLDYKTHRPIAGVELTGDCGRSNLVHGTRSLRTLKARADSDGRYRFSFFETWHCSLFFLNAEKPGYVRLIAAEIPNVAVSEFYSVPAITWMVKEKDVVPLRLEGLFAETGGQATYTDGSGRRAYFEEFSWTLDRFARAKKIATTEEQRTWVKQRFCSLLSRKFLAIPSTERTRPSSAGPQFMVQMEDWRATCSQATAQSG